MAGNVDQRIVQMQFENAQFERNIAKSTKSLMDFKEQLDFKEVSSGLSQFGKEIASISFEKLSNGVQALADRFTGLGNVAEMVTYQIRQRIESLVASMSSFVDSMTTAQITAGKAKYEQLNKTVQTIKNATGKSEEDVYRVMERLNDYTDQTSYNFSDMADNISKFTSVGKDLDESEKAMEGIANWAALSGAGVTEASRAMYNLSQAMGTGSVKLIDWKSIENARMGTVAFKEAVLEAAAASGDLSKEVGKDGKAIYKTANKYGKATEVTVENFSSTLNKGWFTADVLMAVLNEFGDTTTELGKKAYEAAQKCTTFTDVIQAWRDQISTGWMNSFRLAFGDLSESMDFFSNVCNKVSDGIKQLIDARNMVIRTWGNNNGRTNLFSMVLGEYDGNYEGIYGILDIISDAKSLLWNGFLDLMSIFAPGYIIASSRIDPNFIFAWIGIQLAKATENVKNTLQRIRDFFSEDIIIGGKVTNRLEMFRGIVDGIAAAFAYAYFIINGLITFFSGVAADLTPSFDAITAMFAKLGKGMLDSAGKENKKQGILKFFEDLREETKPLTDGINNFVGAITRLVLKILELAGAAGETEDGSNAFLKGISTIVSGLSNTFGPMFTFLANMSDILLNLITNGFDEESMSQLGERIGSSFQAMLDAIVEGMPEGIKNFWNGLKTLFAGNGEAEGEKKNFLDALGDMFANMDISKVLGVAGSAFGLIAFVKLFGIVKKVKESINGVTDFFSNLGKNFFSTFLKFFSQDEEIEKKIHFAGLVLLIASIGYLVSQVAALGNVQNLAGSLIGLGVILGLIVGFQYLVKRLDLENTKMLGIGALAYGIGAMVNSLKPLADMEWGNMAKMGAGLVVVMAALLGFAKKIYEFPGNPTAKMAGVVGLAVGIGLLIFALRPLANMEWGNMAKMGVGLVVVMAMLLWFAKKIYEFPGDPTVKMAGVVGLAVGIGLLIFAIRPLADMEWGNLAKMGVGLIVTMGVLLWFARKVYEFPGDPTVKMAGILGLAVGIGLLIFAIRPLANMEWGDMAKMGVGLIVTMGVLFWFARKVYEFPGDPTVKMAGILGLAVGIGLLIFAVRPLGNMEWGGLAKMGAGLIVTMGVLLWFAKKVYEFPGDPTVKMAGIIGLAAGIGLLILALTPLSGMEWSGLAKMGIGLVVVMAALLTFAKKMQTVKLDTGKILSLVVYAAAISAVILAFSVGLMAAQGVDVGTILAFSAGLSAVLLAMSTALKISSGVGLVSGVKGLLLLAAGMAVLIGVLSAMIPVLMGSVGNSIQSMAGKLRHVAEMISDFTTAMNGVGSGDIDSARSKIDQLKDLLISLKNFKGLEGNIDAFSTAIWTLGVGLETFSDHMNKVGDLSGSSAMKLLRDINENYEGIDTLAKMNLSNLQANIAGLGGAMMLYAMGVEDVAAANGRTGNNGVDEQAITAAVEIMQKISESLVENGNFVIPNMPDEQSLTDWGVQLAALAGALVKFEEAGSGLGKGTDKALDTLGFFDQLKAKLEDTTFKDNMAWVGQYMSGWEDEEGILRSASTGEAISANVDVLTQFGFHIEALGKSLRGFAEATTNFNEETGEMEPIDYSKATDALNTFVAIKNTLPSVGGIQEWINGQREKLTDLGTDIDGLATGLMSFSKKMNGETEEGGTKFDPTAVTAATTAIETMAGCIQTINEKIPLANAAYGEGMQTISWTPSKIGKEFEGLGDGLWSLGVALTQFGSTVVSGSDGQGQPFNPESTTNAVKAMDAMVSFMVQVGPKLPTIGGMVEWFDTLMNGREMTMAELGDRIGQLGDGIGKLGAGLNTGGWANAEGTTQALNAIDTILDMCVKLGELQALDDVAGSPLTWIDNLSYILDRLTGTNELISGKTPTYTIIESLTNFMSRLSIAMEDITPDAAKLESLNMIASILNNLSNVNVASDFSVIGVQIATGVATGIKRGASEVIQAAIDMANDAYIGAARTLGIKSPSRVFAEIGDYMAAGMAMGMEDGTRTVISSSEALASDAIQGASDVISIMGNLLDNDLETNPTISPVLDLTNFNTGIASMQEAMSGQGMTIDTSAAGRYAMNSVPGTGRVEGNNQNGTDLSGIYSRMDQFTTQINNLSTSISNMQIVLDSGVVAGGVTDGVDRNLGRKSFYAHRGN